MAKDSHLPPALRAPSKKVKEKQRAQRQRVRSKAAQARARKTEKAKSHWGNVKQAVQDVRESEATALGAMAFGGRGKGPRPPKTGGGYGSPPRKGFGGYGSQSSRVPGRKTHRSGDPVERAEKSVMTKGTDPGYRLKKKASKAKQDPNARRDYLEDPRSTRGGGGDMHPMDAPAAKPTPKRPGKKKTYVPREGFVTRAEGGLHTPQTRALNKARLEAKDKGYDAAGRGLAKVSKQGLMYAPPKKQRSAARRENKDLRQFSRDERVLGEKLDKAKKGKTFKVKKKAPAKGKRTELTRKKTKGPAIQGAKARVKDGVGGPYKPRLRKLTKSGTAKTERSAKRYLGTAKDAKAKLERKLKTSVDKADAGTKAGMDFRGKMITAARKDVGVAKRRSAKAAAGTAYKPVRRHWNPRLPVKAEPGSTPPLGKGKRGERSRTEGSAHITGPKVKETGWSETKPKAAKVSAPSRRTKGKKVGTGTRYGDIETRADMYHPGDFKTHKLRKAVKPVKAVRKGKGLSSAQKIALLAAGAGAIGASKRKEAKEAKDRADRVARAKSKVLRPKKAKAVERPPAKKKRRKETADEKNKRLNIRFKSAAQVQARKYPSKEK